MLKIMLIISIPILILMYLLLLFINEMNDKSIFYGVRIPLGYEKRDDLIALKKEYKKKFSIYFFLGTVIYILLMFSLQKYCELIFILYIFAIPVVMVLVHYQIYLKVRQIKKREGWLLNSRNKVVVDLSYRNNKKERISVSSWWFLIPAYLCIVSGVIAQRCSEYMFFIFQVLITALLFSVNLVVKRAKQNINGGEIDKVISASKKLRYGFSKVNLISTVLMNISFLMCSILFVTYNDSQILWLIAFSIIILSAIFEIGYLIKLARQRHNTVLAESLEGKVIINRDDDNNYKFGMFYYNKNDPAIIVEKRVGIGWDLNYAKTQTKIFIGFIAAVIIATIATVAYVVPASMEEAKVTLTDNTVIIEQKLYGEEISYSDIEDINILDNIDKSQLFKRDGSAVNNLFIGNFNVKDLGSAKLYIMDNTKDVIEIKLKDGTYVMINYKDIVQTEKLMKSIEEKIK